MVLVFLLLLLFLGCTPPAAPPAKQTPATPAFEASQHPEVKLSIVGPDGEQLSYSLEDLAKRKTATMLYEDHLYGGQREYVGLELSELLALCSAPDKVEVLKFHARDGFVSEVPRKTLAKGKFLLAFRDAEAAPATFLAASEIEFLNQEPKRLTKALESAPPEKREELEKERDHLNTLLTDLTGLKNQGPFYPIFTATESRWNPPFCVEKVTLAAAATDRSAALPKGLEETHPAMRGAKSFKKRCAVCHSINGVGGSVGPELNRPMSVTSYWDEGALRKLLHDPKSVRENSKMPAMRLKKPIVDDILAYLQWMDQHR